MNLREAAQQALEALEAWEDAAPSQWTTRDEKTITALRAALEQPDPVAAEREACAKICESLQDWPEGSTPYDCASAIRARNG